VGDADVELTGIQREPGSRRAAQRPADEDQGVDVGAVILHGLPDESHRAEEIGASAVIGMGVPVGRVDGGSTSRDEAGERSNRVAHVRLAAVPEQHVSGPDPAVHVRQSAGRVLDGVHALTLKAGLSVPIGVPAASHLGWRRCRRSPRTPVRLPEQGGTHTLMHRAPSTGRRAGAATTSPAGRR
jgi:hypothetical protein